jgi:hypothetical protein
MPDSRTPSSVAPRTRAADSAPRGALVAEAAELDAARRRKLVELGLARCRRGRSVATAVEVRSMRFSAMATPSVEVIPTRVTNTRRAHERPSWSAAPFAFVAQRAERAGRVAPARVELRRSASRFVPREG